MDLINLGRLDYDRGIRFQASQKERAYFDKWESFCSQTGIKDKFLSDVSKGEKIELLCAFAAAIRRNLFGKTKKKVLLAGSVKDTLRHVRQVFRSNGLDDPGADDSDRTALRITRILSSYEKADPNTSNQSALPLIFFEHMRLNDKTRKSKHLGLLAGGALFFGIRSCEYLKPKNANKKQTRLLRIKNFQFMKKNLKPKFLHTKHNPSRLRGDNIRVPEERLETSNYSPT